MSGSLLYLNDQLAKAAPRRLRLVWNITAADTFAALPQHTAALLSAGAVSQATIDDFLGSTNEFLAAGLDATSLGNDAVGGLVNMMGQVKDVVQMVATCYSATNTVVTRQCQKYGADLQATTLATQYAVSTSGNVAFKVDFGNTPDFDGLTAGTIVIEFDWIAK